MSSRGTEIGMLPETVIRPPARWPSLGLADFWKFRDLLQVPAWEAAERGVWARFIELAGEFNESMPQYVVDKAVEVLDESGKSVRGAKVLDLGFSYKADIDDDRESPSFEIIELLKDLGADVAYCDPYAPKVRRMRKHDLGLVSVLCNADEFGRYDVLVVSTAHREFRNPALRTKAKLLVDARNLFPAGTPACPVVRA